MKSKKTNKPKLCFEINLSEYMLAVRQVMKAEGLPHVTGFAESQLEVGEDDLRRAMESAIKHGLIIGDEESGYSMDPLLYGFIKKYAYSKNVVTLFKPSFGSSRLISFVHSGEAYICVVQDSDKDRALCLADDDVHILYEYVEDIINRKDSDKGLNIKNINKELKSLSSDITLTVKPDRRIFLSCLCNLTGNSLDRELLYHVSEKEYERITLYPDLVIEGKKDTRELGDDICEYIIDNCPPDNDEISTNENMPGAGEKKDALIDPEPFTKRSFCNIVRGKDFPNSPGQFFGRIFKTIRQSFSWKSVAHSLLMMAAVTLIVAVWNLFSTCYLNDSFRLTMGKGAPFGGLTPYLTVGRIMSKDRGLDLVSNLRGIHPSNVLLISNVYLFIMVALKSFLSDLFSGSLFGNLRSIFTFRRTTEKYRAVIGDGAKTSFYVGLIFATFLNVILYNPVSVFLLGLLLIVSCAKGDNSVVSGSIMVSASAFRYKAVTDRNKKVPLYSAIQMLVLNTGYGLLLHTLLNTLLWFAVDFDYRVRFAVSGVTVLFAIVQLIINKVKPGKTVIASMITMFIVGAGTIMTLSNRLLILADDGGWTESGGLGGLLKNQGFPYILGLALAVGVCVAISLAIFGAAASVIAAAALLSAVGAGIWASQDDNYKVAANLLLDDESPYANDAEARFKAHCIDTLISFIPIVGDVVGAAEALRDYYFAYKNNDKIGEFEAIVNLGFSVSGLSEASEMKKAGRIGEEVKKMLVDSADNLVHGRGIRELEKAIADGDAMGAISAANDIKDDYDLAKDGLEYIAESQSNSHNDTGTGVKKQSGGVSLEDAIDDATKKE